MFSLGLSLVSCSQNIKCVLPISRCRQGGILAGSQCSEVLDFEGLLNNCKHRGQMSTGSVCRRTLIPQNIPNSVQMY